MEAQERLLPDADRLGLLTATVLVAFAMTRILPAPEFTVTLQLPGFYFAVPLTLELALSLLAAGLTATGMAWLLRTHPSLGGKSTVEHWLLPTLTTLVVGITLSVLPTIPVWWAGLGASAVLIVLVFMAEYVVVEPAAPYYPVARAGLTALSYALFLILATALRMAGTRLVVLIPVIFVAGALIALRILHLDGADTWDFPWAAGIGLVCTQLAAGLHYWPLLPLQFGLALTGPLYALTLFSANITDGIPVRSSVRGPLAVLGLLWAGAFLLR
ncbi:MAG: hypothetical protein ACM3QS_02845 [Bacteroidota bacterium]